MATFLQGSGAISMSQINTVFARGNSISNYTGTQYYTSSAGPFTFSAGPLGFSAFYGTGPQSNVLYGTWRDTTMVLGYNQLSDPTTSGPWNFGAVYTGSGNYGNFAVKGSLGNRTFNVNDVPYNTSPFIYEVVTNRSWDSKNTIYTYGTWIETAALPDTQPKFDQVAADAGAGAKGYFRYKVNGGGSWSTPSLINLSYGFSPNSFKIRLTGGGTSAFHAFCAARLGQTIDISWIYLPPGYVLP